MTLHVQVVPPHDHDALLNRILHFLEHKYEIAHATVQMEYQPCSGPECHLNTMHAGTIITTTISQKTRENLAHARCLSTSGCRSTQ